MRLQRIDLPIVRAHHGSADVLLSDQNWSRLLEEYPILAGFSAGELEQLRGLAERFNRVKRFEAADGLELSGYMKAAVSLQACLPILNLGLKWYSNWKTIVVVPAGFSQKQRQVDKAGVVHEWKEVHIGESWIKGPVVLSWKDVAASGLADGFNVVIHEAAHRLDMLDGAMNGRPALHREMSPERWRETFSEAYTNLAARMIGGAPSAIDAYALENPGEFFAVFSEVFFERPSNILLEYPRVYGLLKEFYRQDPVRRLPA
ncbi:MAG: zinc-dependent peptidase [Anaerolineales bacterium]|jgi:Mlc titration factor MtfA (ptsG expression regulator)